MHLPFDICQWRLSEMFISPATIKTVSVRRIWYYWQGYELRTPFAFKGSLGSRQTLYLGIYWYSGFSGCRWLSDLFSDSEKIHSLGIDFRFQVDHPGNTNIHFDLQHTDWDSCWNHSKPDLRTLIDMCIQPTTHRDAWQGKVALRTREFVSRNCYVL